MLIHYNSEVLQRVITTIIYLIEGDNIQSAIRDAAFSQRDMMDNTPLRYSSNLLSIDWKYLIEKDLPLLSHQRKNSILHVAGQFAVNPLLLLGKIIQEKNDLLGHSMKSDEEFRMSIKSFANNLSRYDHEFDAESMKIETSSLEYSLRKLFKDNEKLLDDFLQICDRISTKYDIATKYSKTIPIAQQTLFTRNEEETIELELPYASSECWHLGKE